MDFKKYKFMSLDEFYKLFESINEIKYYFDEQYYNLPGKYVRSQAAKVNDYILIKKLLILIFKNY